MRHYIHVYKRLMQLNFSALVAFRGNFINNLISSFIWAIFSLSTIYLLTLRVTSIFGWRREDILLFTGLYGVVIGFFHTIFSRNFSRFSRVIHHGELDILLLKPIDTQFLMSFWIINYTSLSRIPIGVLFVGYLLVSYHIPVAPFQILSSIFLVSLSIVLLYAIWYIVMTLTIWFTNLSNLVEILFQMTSIARYPQEVFRELSAYLFWFIMPLTFVISTPAKVLLQRANAYDLIGLFIFSITLLFLSRKFWKFALRFYTSASS